MGIERFYKIPVKHYTSEYEKVDGRMVRTDTLQNSFKCAIEPLDVIQQIIGDKETFTITHRLYASTEYDISFGDIIKVDSKEFKVIKNVDPMMMNHHQEVLLEAQDYV